ncbi:kinase-like protein [Ophiobolus disseminans]|uniref:non-specific serine/threonine protein kinase n=1 Tax=Ophiobolus disseminans TaxID=1469910 RepID=A0A6A7AA49_9PLEO|nr:kinase-like protein [Ophiobolus disseminans]
MPEDDKYDVLEKIGHGSFGIIRKVKRKSDGYILCRKEISYTKMSAKEREQLQSELSILKELRHPNIVAYFERDHIKASQDLHLYMEYCGNGDLGRVIRDLKSKNQVCEEEFVWSIFSQIVSALYRCHFGEDPPPAGRNVMGLGANAKPVRDRQRPMILHRDLKPENIFLGEDNSVKLGDFGLSKILTSHDFASTYVGTPFYMSPEICKAEQYGPHSDIWALGCIIYEMCTKTPPFNAKTHFDLIQKIKSGRYPDIPACYSAELRKVIASCLQTVPDSRPDTAQLLNLPIVKLMRKEQEVVKLGRELREQKQLTAQREKETEVRLRREINDQLRREWEVKAQLEIERQVKIQTEQRVEAELAILHARFEKEVNERIEKALRKFPNRLSTSPKLAPRSDTPLMPATEQGVLFPTDNEASIISGSTSTLGTNSDFASGTDMSSLSLEDSTEDTVKELKPIKAAKPTRRPRNSLTRAQTYASAVPASPMDIQMADPSPAPASYGHLGLSPRRNQQPRVNIFAAAKDNAKKWEPELPPSAGEDDWNVDIEDDDDYPVLPSPTRARSASGGRLGGDDPFKALANAQRHLMKPNSRLGSTPNLLPKATKPRPTSAVPIVATSPTRPKSRSAEALSTSPRKTGLPSKSAPVPFAGLPSKKGNEAFRIQAMRNHGGVQGRTLVELSQARGIPVQAMSEDEGKKGFGYGARKSPIKGRSAGISPPAVWDPDTTDELDMPSPFIRRSRQAVR